MGKYNTFHLPTKTRWFMGYETEEELRRILRDKYFQECLSLHIGGGSSLLFISDYNGITIHPRIKGISISVGADEYVSLCVGIAKIWDDIMACAVPKGWGGIGSLFLIPSEAGAAAIQNIGAYGMGIKNVIESVEAYNQLAFEERTFTSSGCEYGYCNDYFRNEHHNPHIITYITLRLSKNPGLSVNYGNLREEPMRYPEVTLEAIREAVIATHRQELPDPEVSGNASSFFTNPITTAEHFEKLKKQFPGIPPYPASEGKIKVPVGRLIEQCGFRGKNHGPVGVYEKQALILVNLGGARGDRIALVAESIRIAVKNCFGTKLMSEVRYVG